MSHPSLIQLIGWAQSKLDWTQSASITQWVSRAGIASTVVYAASAGVFQVGSNENAVVTLGGDIRRVVEPGLHLEIPFLETARKLPISNFNVSTGTEKNEKGELIGTSTITKDPQEVFVTVTAEITLPQGEGLKYIVTHLPNYEEQLRNYLTQVTKAVVGTYLTNELPSKRDEIGEKIKLGLSQYIKQGGHDVIKVKTVQLINLNPNRDYVTSLNEAAAENPRLDKARVDLEISRVRADTQAAEAEGTAQALRTKGQAARDFPEAVKLAEIERWNGDGVKTLVTGSPNTPLGIFTPGDRTAKPSP